MVNAFIFPPFWASGLSGLPPLRLFLPAAGIVAPSHLFFFVLPGLSAPGGPLDFNTQFLFSSATTYPATAKSNRFSLLFLCAYNSYSVGNLCTTRLLVIHYLVRQFLWFLIHTLANRIYNKQTRPSPSFITLLFHFCRDSRLPAGRVAEPSGHKFLFFAALFPAADNSDTYQENHAKSGSVVLV
jgi:hypothetical protein